jgi:hypothetical protein
MKVREFSVCVKTEGLNLPRQGVMLVWEFVWTNDDESSESEDDVASCEQYNPHLHSDSDLSASQ